MQLFEALTEPASAHSTYSSAEGNRLVDRPWSDVVHVAETYAAGLSDRGIGTGSRVGCVLGNDLDSTAFLLGVWWTGATLMSFPTPARGVDPVDYLAQLRMLCGRTRAELLVLDEEFAGMVDAGNTPVIGYRSLPRQRRVPQNFPGDDEIAFVQYSSGSTSAPKGCSLTPAAIGNQLDLISARLEPDPATGAVYSWLPLSHDMGLFGGLLWPWASGQSLVQSSPTRFLRAPYTWLEECVERSVTTTVGPSFGLSIALRAARRSTPKGRLSLRDWIIGSDPIEYGLINEAVDVLGDIGLRSSVFQPAYGMAETTLAVSMTVSGSDPRPYRVDLDALYRGELAEAATNDRAAAIVSCGPPMAGTDVWIDGDEEIGEIMVRSPSMATGYLDDPERTARTFPSPGVLRTGDRGFIRDGELYVIGRDDDMVSVGGRNVYTSILENRLGSDPRVRSGSCALVDVQRDEDRSLIVVLEPAAADIDFAATARSVRAAAATEAGIGISECVFVPRGQLPKSPSGKIQRFKCRAIAGGDDGNLLARVAVG
ncbi:AMP-binding protein [Williamsia sterculiae]|uniref:Fatty-acyl-CoA synthase n=1 Tax=Williamsia sterculiae TaxID=1344003 RepID=A0A1N7DPC6_9NOCA|nr:AMP-binding protein [Williamsia sterculiae]SIR77716.1 fatty-acyl-CoA synthase [Williamsia sterculiae]